MPKKEVTEQDFLRAKTQTLFESSAYVTDSATGEILHEDVALKKRVSTEPDYIKVYYKAMMAVSGIDEIPLTFLLGLSAQLNFVNGDSSVMLFYNNKTTRRALAEYCGIGDNMTLKYIKRCVAKGVLFSTCDRGTYEVNPWLIAKGKWEHIRKLQASFEFVKGTWRRVVEEDDAEPSTPATPVEEDKSA